MSESNKDNQKDISDFDDKLKQVRHKAGVLTDEERAALEARKQKTIQASASAGVEFAAAIIFSTLLGIWIDKQTQTAPLFMMLFLILGACVAFYNLYRTSENLNSLPKESDSQLHSAEKNGKKSPTNKES